MEKKIKLTKNESALLNTDLENTMQYAHYVSDIVSEKTLYSNLDTGTSLLKKVLPGLTVHTLEDGAIKILEVQSVTAVNQKRYFVKCKVESNEKKLANYKIMSYDFIRKVVIRKAEGVI